ncbi:MAG: ATP-dependent acyl-CoA ligase [Betaproteobacteria bacterium]|nr:ATP-dependent acyl-CoA ligase [Betaproteobacteria bacterium]
MNIDGRASGVTTVHGAFAEAAGRHANKPFLHVPASASGNGALEEYTYAAFAVRVDALARQYRECGYGPGHRVALMLGNRAACFAHYLALNAVGASAVPLNPDYLPNELEYVLGHSEAEFAVVLPEMLQKLSRLPASLVRVVVADESFDPPRARAQRLEVIPGEATEAALLYTSGTTGKPKACIIGNLYCLHTGRRYLAQGGLCAVDEGRERLITPLPMFHMNAIAVSLMAMVLSGGCVVPLDRFHPSSWWSEVVKSGATIFHYLGIMPAILMSLPAAAEERATRLKFGFGAGVNPRDHERFEQRFGFPLIEAWSMTETGGGAMIVASHEPRFPGTRCMGLPGPELAVRIVDEQDRDVDNGAPGNLLVRGDGADPRAGFFSGYFRDAEATALAWRGGWFRTGDVVRRGPAGHLHFVDRSKNIIRRSGENIAALEVEAVLATHPAVQQAAVIALADDLREEEVMACVVLKPGAGAGRDAALSIQDFCLAQLAYFKAPGYVAFVPSLPTTSTNKIQKGQLAAMHGLLDPGSCFDLRVRKKRQA